MQGVGYMECEKIQLCLPEYVKGLLGDDEKRSVLRHIEECGACREETEEIRQMLEYFSHARSTMGAPTEDLEESVWSAVYQRIREKKLHKKSRGIVEKLRQLGFYPRPGILQIANVIIIIAAGTWFYYSYHSDNMKEREDIVQVIIGKATPESGKSAANTILQNRDAIVGAVARVASNPEIPLEKIQGFLDRENKEQLYDSVTDFFAEMVIRFSEKS